MSEINQISVTFENEERPDDSFSDSSLYEPVYNPYSTPPNSMPPRDTINAFDSNEIPKTQSNEYAVYNNSHREQTISRFRLHWKKIAAFCVLLAISITVGLVVKMPDNEEKNFEVAESNFPSSETQKLIISSTEPSKGVQSTKRELSTKDGYLPARTYATLISTSKVNKTTTTAPKKITEATTKSTPDELTLAELTPTELTPTTECIHRVDLSQWNNWSQCSKSCGDGDKTRERVCQDGSCSETLLDSIRCNERGCELREYRSEI